MRAWGQRAVLPVFRRKRPCHGQVTASVKRRGSVRKSNVPGPIGIAGHFVLSALPLSLRSAAFLVHVVAHIAVFSRNAPFWRLLAGCGPFTNLLFLPSSVLLEVCDIYITEGNGPAGRGLEAK